MTKITTSQAELIHSKLIWEWRNDPVSRKMSVSSKFIPFEEHNLWYRKTLKDKKKKFI